MIKPTCKFCSSKNIEIKSVDQWYLALSKYHDEFRTWFESVSPTWRKTIGAFVDSLTKENMVDRAITRDLDWGIDVPLSEAIGKKLYVWFDAPIGYVSNTKEYLKQNNIDEDYLTDWWASKDTTITNFIGKDNIIFHAIIFPMMSLASGRVDAVKSLPANQYVNLEGKQFSKSAGWYVDAHSAVDEFGTDALRYYLTTLIPESNDSSFTWENFEAKINNELANNIGNFVNRCLTFFYKNWENGIKAEHFMSFFESADFQDMQVRVKEINETIDGIHIKKGLEQIMALGQVANTFFSDRAPWAQIKEDDELAQETIAHSAIYALTLACLLTPYLPVLSAQIKEYFGPLDEKLIKDIYIGEFTELRSFLAVGISIKKKPQGLVTKIDKDRIKELGLELKELGKTKK